MLDDFWSYNLRDDPCPSSLPYQLNGTQADSILLAGDYCWTVCLQSGNQLPLRAVPKLSAYEIKFKIIRNSKGRRFLSIL